MTLTSGTRLGHYEIRAKVGAGGMGEVYLAQDTKLDRKVALKVLPADLAANQERMRRFTQEAKAAAALNHPNIAHIYEIGESDGLNFIAMEFVEGQTLRQQFHQEKGELRNLLRHLLPVADGLAKAHSAGIVHRDLKPENIMITIDGHAKILDFGLAKLLATEPEAGADRSEAETAVMPAQLSTPGAVMGTVGYMSPEQAQGRPVDQRSDIFSFGCLLYEAATGRKPFVADSTVDTLHKIIHDPAPAISDFNPSAPAELQRLIRKCLAKEPDKRFQTIRDAANDLEELIDDLKGLSGIDRSLAPSSTSTASVLSSATVAAESSRTAEVSAPATRVEFTFTETKRYRLGALIALAVVAGAAALFGYYLYTRNSRATISSIAVLPFQNRNSDADTDYLAEGLAESLIYRLSQLPNLKVSPTSSVMRYGGKDVDPLKVAAELNVDAVMSGRLVQRGDNLNISLELIDARTNKLLWGEQYERKMSDLMATQREIASMVAEKLQVKLSGNDNKGITKRYTNNNEAYQHYLKGRFYWNKRTGENLKRAIEQLSAAAEKDPNFGLAWAGLADCYVLLSYYTGSRPAESVPQAKAYAMKSIELDDTLAEPHATLGMVKWNFEWDKEGAEREFKRAIELNPNYPTAHQWYSRFLRAMGRTDEALIEIKRAAELDPLSLVVLNNLAENYYERGDFETSLGYCQKMIELDPGYWSAHSLLGGLYARQGRYAEAVAEGQKAVDLTNRSNLSLAMLGNIYGRAGRRTDAQSIVAELEKRFEARTADARDLALVWAGLNDKDKAFEWLEKAYQYRSFQLGFLRLEPFLVETLSQDPRWADLCRRIGIPL